MNFSKRRWHSQWEAVWHDADLSRCGIGSWGGQFLSLAPYVMLLGPTEGAAAARGC